MINQTLAQKQRLKILPQQIQLLNFFHLNTLELEQRILQEIEDNPLLEDQKNEFEPVVEKFNKDSVQDYQDWEEYGYDDIPDYKLEYNNYLHDDKLPERPVVNSYDYRKSLMEQDMEALAEDISFKQNKWVEAGEIIKILENIQQLEPVGIGARNIRECLLIQLNRMNTKRPD